MGERFIAHLLIGFTEIHALSGTKLLNLRPMSILFHQRNVKWLELYELKPDHPRTDSSLQPFPCRASVSPVTPEPLYRLSLFPSLQASMFLPPPPLAAQSHSGE